MVFTCLILIGKAIAGRGGKIPKVISLTEPNAIELLRTKGRVSVPEYYREGVTPGILHFGVGNFFRAHLATYIEELLNAGQGNGWGIIGANVIEDAEPHRRALQAQGLLSTVVEQGTGMAHRGRVIGSLIDYYGVDELAKVVDKLADPAIRIVTLTITEGGYFIDPATGQLNTDHPILVADSQSPKHPHSVFGLIVAGLRRRRADGIVPFTVCSCDNILHNGDVARSAVVGLTRLMGDEDMAQWIADMVAFPNGMVDRITPATGEDERRRCKEEFGIEDAQPVFCEAYRQWVLEDNFPAGRPPLEQLGVLFVNDVTPYENMKLRILNGGHVVLAHMGALLGIEYVHETLENRLVHAFWQEVVLEEIVPVVPPVPGQDLEAYAREIKDRFSNPQIKDTIRRLCFDSSNRVPKFVHPSIEDRLAEGKSVGGLALVSAFWCQYSYQILPKMDRTMDPRWEELTEKARLAVKENPDHWLNMEDLYSAELRNSQAFRTAFAKALKAIQKAPIEAVMRDYLKNRGIFANSGEESASVGGQSVGGGGERVESVSVVGVSVGGVSVYSVSRSVEDLD